MTEKTTTVIEHTGRAAAELSDGRETLNDLIAQLDEVDDDAEGRILLQVLSANDAEDVDAPWQSRKLSDWKDQIVTVHTLRRLPSTMDPRVPYFLVVQGVEGRTGRPVTATTSSKAVMAQLIRLYTLGALPLSVIPRKAERPTQSGNYPEHLEIVR